MPERLWTVRSDKKGNHYLYPSEPLYCPLCGEPLVLHDFSCYEHRYPDGQPELKHCDIHMKCPRCGLWLTFGVPVTREELGRLRRSRYHSRTLRWELRDISPDDYERIKDRLSSWGYW